MMPFANRSSISSVEALGLPKTPKLHADGGYLTKDKIRSPWLPKTEGLVISGDVQSRISAMAK